MAQIALAESLEHKRALISDALEATLPAEDREPQQVHAAMRYATLGPGKRLRPIMTLAVTDLVSAPPESVIDAACAIEFVHAASLVLDDLPSMDNAQNRRGMPCTHHEYGEATALLAAMGLIALAYECLSRNGARAQDPAFGVAAVKELAHAMGTDGIIAGQHTDLGLVEQEASLDELALAYIQKAGALFIASATIPARLLGFEESQVEALAEYANHLGLAFQITDDLIDEQHHADHRDRTTYTTHLGVQGAKDKVRTLVKQAVEALAPFDERADLLRIVAEQVAARSA